MAKYHVNDKGNPGNCKAVLGNCPFGGASQHYATKELAQQAFELSMASQKFTKARVFKQAPLSELNNRERNYDFMVNVESLLSKDLTGPDRNRLMMTAQTAFGRIDKDVDSFEATRMMSKKIEELAKDLPHLGIDEDELYGLKSSAFIYVSPKVGKAAQEMESELSIMMDTRGFGGDPLNFEQTFVKAAQKQGATTNASDFAMAFSEVIADERDWNYEGEDEERDIIKSAAEKAYAVINKDKPGFRRELRQFA